MFRRFRKAVPCLILAAGPASAAVFEVSPGDDLRAAIAGLAPGDELRLRRGRYEFDSRFNISVKGTADRPITITAEPGEDVLIEMRPGDQNVLEVQDSEYLVLAHLRFRGGSHGIRLMSSNHITIEDNEIFEVGDVGISANAGGTYSDLVIRGNQIHHTGGTGEGMYLGCNYDACRVMNSLVERNYIYDTNGPTVTQGDGIELKEGSAGNLIRDNVIHDTGYPGIITYSTVGNGPPNVIEGNLIWNTGDNGIQSAADSVIRNNIVLGAPIVLQAHQSGSPSNQIVVNNTLITDGSGIDVRNVSGPVLIANNAVYSRSSKAIRLISGDIGLVTVTGNVGHGGITGGKSGFSEGDGLGTDFVGASYGAVPPIDPFPKGGGALIGAGASAYVPDFDFNGTPRNGAADVGAYKFAAGGNPGWPLQAGFKQSD